MARRLAAALPPLLLSLAAGCGSSGDASEPEAGGLDETAGDAEPAAGDVPDAVPDAAGDAAAEPEPLPVFTPIASPPAGSVLPDGVDSCAVYGEEACDGDGLRRCAVFDGAAGEFRAPEEVPPRTLQAFVFDRYHDLYHRFEGQTVDIDFTAPVPAGTPEEEWSKPEHFARMDAYGDSSGWTGTATFGAAARYRVTGTDADYERMLASLEASAFMYEVTDIPGMMARSHWAMMPEGVPVPPGHWGKALGGFYESGQGWHFHYPISAAHWDRLPAYYKEGIEVGGATVPTEPRWQGDASRDMYVRGLPGILMAYDLLRDGEREDRLRDVLRTVLPCTLNRLKKGVIRNLQSAPEVLEGVTAWLTGQNLVLDPGDLDFATLDTLVVYVMEQPNPAHLDLFDPTCPDGPPTEVDPELDLDATADDFLLDFLTFAQRLEASHERPIVWPMIASVRSGDLLFLTQWALVAHYLTGDERYRDFLGGLMAETEYWGVLRTWGAYQLPKWCQSHYAPSLSYPSLYNVLARIDRAKSPEFWRLLSEVAAGEVRAKEMEPREDVYFGVLYGRMVDAGTDPGGAAFVAHHVDLLATYGMNPADKLDPDRNYTRNWIDPPDPTIALDPLTPDAKAVCTAPIEVLGLTLESPGLDDENPRALDPLPLSKRVGGGFLWTSDPWELLRDFGPGAMTVQYPMLGMTVPYWLARSDGHLQEGAGLALAWQPTGDRCP